MMYQKNTLESTGLKVELPMIQKMNNKGAVDFFTVLLFEVAHDISMLNVLLAQA
jgi:hypothetical protein